jgi:hypothetical protein
MATYVIIWAWKKTVLVLRKNVFSLKYCYFQIRKIEHNGVGGLYIFCEQVVLYRSVFYQKWVVCKYVSQIANPQICGIYCGPSANMAICEFATCGPNIFFRFADLQFVGPIFFLKLKFLQIYNVLIQIFTAVNKKICEINFWDTAMVRGQCTASSATRGS